MKKSLVFGILLSICMTIPIMADTSNSGIVIEPISSLQEQLEEMTEEQKVIAIEKYYSVEDEKIVEKRILKLPKQITNVIKCKNPRCITSIEQGLDQVFILADPEKEVYRCKYCEEKYTGKRNK